MNYSSEFKKHHADVVILGGGVIGLTTAIHLRLAGLNKVIVLDSKKIGKEASWAGAGLLWQLLPWDYPAELTEVVLESLAMYPEWIHTLEKYSRTSSELLQSGLKIYPPFDYDKAKLWFKAFKIPYEYLAEDQTLWLPDVYTIRNPRYLQALIEACAKLDIDIIEEVHLSQMVFKQQGKPFRHLLYLATNKGQFYGRRYVLSAGAWSGILLSHTNVYPMKGQILLFKTAPDVLKHAIFAKGCYIVPRQDGHVLVGSTLERVGFDKTITDEAKALLLEIAYQYCPALKDATLVDQWAGLRPASDHPLPLVQRDPIYQNLFLNTGHFRYGVTLAPWSAKNITHQILADLIS